ncbi:hypothetical protein QE177_08405 [Arsenophonus sp. aPb]|uniref:hypothetical protein n=1 Tax=Arsenophonus sp. aPb TaxID=3041619 RepID=UPI0024686405|nr:hypothetical protein [Arsenophonus sp. aPb]WGL97253.1 hypothetical protein QE177_08405 [Arsenophonus sp. aPb]
MKVIADFNFEDGHKLSDYSLELSQDFPLFAEIKNNILILTPADTYRGGELIININGQWDESEPVVVLLKNAKGKAYLDEELQIDNSSPKDSEGNVRIRSLNGKAYLIILIKLGDNFQFTGYKITSK